MSDTKRPPAAPSANTARNGVSRTKIAAASLIGTTIEFYDFYIYGIAAALVFNRLFFPELDPVAGTIASFATFAVGFVSRPIGAAFFGHFGDRVGRKVILVASLLTMGVATVTIGLLPTYAVIGVWAPVLLSVLRFAQGFGLGGEWGGAALLATEYAPPGRRGLFGSFVQLGSAPGFLFSNGIFLILSLTLTDAAFLAWGWRVPFLLSAVLIGVGLWIRLSIAETPVFQKVVERGSQSRVPMVEVLRDQPVQVVVGGLSTALTYVLFFTVGTFGLNYGVDSLGFTRSTMLSLTMVAVLAMAAFTLLGGIWGDKFGRPRVITVSAALAGVWALMFFPVLDTAQPVLVALAFSITLAIMGGVYGPMGAFLPELFRPELRYTGAALAYSLGGIFGGSMAPIIATQLNASFGSRSIGFYLLAMALVSILSVAVLRRRMPDRFEGDEEVTQSAEQRPEVTDR